MTDIVTRIREQTEAFNKQREALVKELETSFHGMFEAIFLEYPQVDRFSWTQYSPYFNDGDECTFSRHEINAFRIMDDEDYEPEIYWEDDEALIESGTRVAAWKAYLETGKFPADFYPYLSDELAKERGFADREAYIIDNTYLMPKNIQSLTLDDMDGEIAMRIAISEFIDGLESIPEDIFETLFGNHVKVTVNREGVEVDEYDHD